MDEESLRRIAAVVVRELDSFHHRFKPQTFDSTEIPAFNTLTRTGGAATDPEIVAKLNNQQLLLALEPFTAYVRAIETKRRNEDDSVISSDEVIYFVNRQGYAGLQPETPNARFIAGGTYLGEIAAEDIGRVEKRYNIPGKPYYLEIEILEKDRFTIDRANIDAIANEVEFLNSSHLIASLRAQYGRSDVQTIEQWELLSDAFGLRDRPNLDKWQNEISRLPLNSRVILSGFPGTGKTTTMIRRLAFKADPLHLAEYEPQAVGSLESWIAFTPNDTLRTYLKEAMTREGLLAPISKLRTWDDQRKILARDSLKIINIESDKGLKPGGTSHYDLWTNELLWDFYNDFRSFLSGQQPDLNTRARNLSKIPESYRRFRRSYAEQNGPAGVFPSSEDLDHKISDPEVDILILSILETANEYFANNPSALSTFTNNDILENIKSCHRRQVAVDEASDFSVVELGCMYHVADPRIRSVTIVGDPMQRLTKRGIADWGFIEKFARSFEVREFQTDYRLTPKLSKIAAVLSGRATSENADMLGSQDRSPFPLEYHAKSPQEFGRWLEQRLIEIYKKNRGQLPTTAIITPTEADIEPTFDLLLPFLERNYIASEPCIQGLSGGEDSRVRIFSSKYIKGLEFDAVFFVNIDEFPEQDLIDKYLYVGLTRARAFLGVTYKNEFPESLDSVRRFFRSGDWSEV